MKTHTRLITSPIAATIVINIPSTSTGFLTLWNVKMISQKKKKKKKEKKEKKNLKLEGKSLIINSTYQLLQQVIYLLKPKSIIQKQLLREFQVFRKRKEKERKAD